MPYDRDDAPAAWWRGAEAMPPMPEGEGPWVQTATPYGWAWRRADEETGSQSFRWAAPGEIVMIRLNDRVRRGDARPLTVSVLTPAEIEATDGIGTWFIRSQDIGVHGSGKPWTLLPREPAPDMVAVPECTDVPHVMPDELPRVAPGANAVCVYAPGGGLIARIGEMTAAEFSRVTEIQRQVQKLRPACLPPSRVFIADVLQAADAVPDPRREAERRVVEAARAWSCTGSSRGLMEALSALAALDRESRA